MRKNNLAESVTFLAATVIGFLLSLNITYIKQKVNGSIELLAWGDLKMCRHMPVGILLARFPNLAKKMPLLLEGRRNKS